MTNDIFSFLHTAARYTTEDIDTYRASERAPYGTAYTLPAGSRVWSTDSYGATVSVTDDGDTFRVAPLPERLVQSR